MIETKPNILLLDDEEPIVQGLKRMLIIHGYRPLTATKPKDAIDILENNDIFILICDQRMPEMTGLEVMQYAKKHFPNVVRILLTGFADMDSTITAINEGLIFRYIKKPWEEHEIIDAIEDGYSYREELIENEYIINNFHLEEEMWKSTFSDLSQMLKSMDEEKKAAELMFLRAQINPHFLYNTLNIFISLARTNIDDAVILLHNYIDYLRKSFDVKDLNQLVPIGEEIDLLNLYLELEKVRLGDMIDICFDIDDGMDINVPALVLQPIVENSIKHGKWNPEKRGIIEVTIKTEGNLVVFKVKDNGAGMDKEKLLAVLNDKHTNGVGLKNIDKRLKNLYGKGLNIASEPGSWIEITWSIPIPKESL